MNIDRRQWLGTAGAGALLASLGQQAWAQAQGPIETLNLSLIHI